MELEEIDRRVSRTRSRRSVTVRACAIRSAASTSVAHSGSPRRYTRRGVRSTTTTTSGLELREPEYDDDGNVLSDGDFGVVSRATSSDSEHHSSSSYESEA